MSVDKFDRLKLKVADLARLDPASMLREVANAAFASGLPLQTLSDLFGERLGPNAVVALKDISENGLPEVDRAIGETADNIEALGSKWALIMEQAKIKTLEWAATTTNAIQDAGAFFGGMFTETDTRPDRDKLRDRFKKDANGNVVPVGSGESMLDRGVNAVNDRRQAESDSMSDARQKIEDALQKAADEIARIADETERRKAQKKADAESKIVKSYMDKIEALQEKAASPSKRSVASGGIQTDSLARIGGFFGGADRGGLSILSKQLQVAEEHKRISSNIEKLSLEMSEALRKTAGEII